MDAIAGVFNSAYKIKEWLIRCAGEIAKSGHPVS